MAALIILGLLDAIAGIILTLGFVLPLGGNPLLFILGVLILIKGILSWIMAAANKLFFDPMAILDIAAAVSCFVEVSGFHLSIFSWIGVILMFKGVYSIGIDAIRQ